MPKDPTMEEVARAAGVARSTVSKAFNNSSRISEATRKRILEVAEALGYRKNPLVGAWMGSIRKGRKVNERLPIAVISGIPIEDMRNDIWVSRMLRGIEARCEELYLKPELFHWGRDGFESARLNRILKTRGIRGVLLTTVHPTRLPELDWEHFSVAAISTTPSEHRCDASCFDHYTIMMQAMERAIALGGRSFGYLPVEPLENEYQQRYIGAFQAMAYRYGQTCRFSICEPGLRLSSADSKSEFAMIVKWVRDEKLDTFLSLYYRMPEHLQDIGLPLPNSVRYVSLDIPTEHVGAVPGICQAYEEVARGALDLLYGSIIRNECGLPEHPRLLLSAGHWVDALEQDLP